MHCVKYHNFTLFPGVNSLSDLLETMRKLCLSTKFPLQEIRWNYSILRSDGEIQLLKLALLKYLTTTCWGVSFLVKL